MEQIKASDCIARNLRKLSDTIFGITGGCIVNMFDSFNKYKFNIITPNHEQAAAMMADAFSRVRYSKKQVGIAVGTSGPGASNLITGTACSYFDSIPVLNIVGQVPSNHLRKNKVRQLGFQEIDAVNIFNPITKYSTQINNINQIKQEFEISINKMLSHRPGPVCIDLCDNVQINKMDDIEIEIKYDNYIDGKVDYNKIESLISNSKKPILILGNGVKLARCEDEAIALAKKWNIPIVLTWATLDILDDDDDLNLRDFGVTSQRATNFSIQESDLLICLGTRLDTHESGSNFNTFAPKANKIIIDIDIEELNKFENCVTINANVSNVITELKKLSFDFSFWSIKTRTLRNNYPICLNSFFESNEINPYVFLNKLSNYANHNAIITTDAGATLTWTMQGWKIKKGQSLFTAFNNSPMGYSIPASIGAYYADLNRQNICIIGDGGFQMNIQELALLAKTNIKVFVLDNDGYGMIRQTQDTWLNSNYIATEGPFCNILNIANAYNIKSFNIENTSNLEDIVKILNFEGPSITRIKINRLEKIQPKLVFGKSIENSFPYLEEIEISNIRRFLND